MDPLAHFDEQQRSYELIERHRGALLAAAARHLRANPGARVVGIISEHDAGDADDVRALPHVAVDESGASVFLVPRAEMLRVLRGNAPATEEWLPPDSSGGVRLLPIAAITRNGYRFAAVAYDSADPPE